MEETMTLSFDDTQFADASEAIDHWLNRLERASADSGTDFAQSVRALVNHARSADMIALAAFSKLGTFISGISATSSCMAEHCDDFIEMAEEKFSSGSIFEAHTSLLATLEQHHSKIASRIKDQRALAKLISEIIGNTITADPTTN